MCGRYTIAKPKRIIKKHFDPVVINCNHQERYNIAPGQNTPVITLQDDLREMRLMRWGLIPPWTKNIQTKKCIINARSETIHQKISFKDSFQTRRCLVPADGFIEWKTQEGRKTPNYIFLKSRDIFAFAGIWKKQDKDASPFYSFSIITTKANSKLASIHERMPVIIEPINYKLWLTPSEDIRVLLNLLSPLSDDKVESHQISEKINSYKNDHNDLLSPISFS